MSLPSRLVGDQSRLKQVLINLVKNAFKFTKRGLITIYASYDYDDDLLRVHVVDTGIGIEHDKNDELFIYFSKLQQEANGSNMEGIGIGLNICKRIVESSGGTIDAFSAGKNRGCTFAFSMKMRLESTEESEAPVDPEAASFGNNVKGGSQRENNKVERGSFVLDDGDECLENYHNIMLSVSDEDESKQDCDLNISAEYDELPSFAPLNDSIPDNERRMKSKPPASSRGVTAQ